MGPEQNHLSFFVKGIEGKADIRAVSWGNAALAPLVESDLIDITFVPERNDFNGNASVQCMVKSLVPSKTNPPDRSALIDFYKFLKSNSSETSFTPFDLCKLSADLKAPPFSLSIATQVFEELGLLLFNPAGDSFSMPPPSRKLNLNESRTWRCSSKLRPD